VPGEIHSIKIKIKIKSEEKNKKISKISVLRDLFHKTHDKRDFGEWMPGRQSDDRGERVGRYLSKAS
jgi:hypothetical protein